MDDDDCCGGRCCGIPPPRCMFPFRRSRCGGASRRAFTSASVVLISLRFTVVPPKNFKKNGFDAHVKVRPRLSSGQIDPANRRLLPPRRDAALNPSGNIARECATCYTSQGENAKLDRKSGIYYQRERDFALLHRTVTAY